SVYFTTIMFDGTDQSIEIDLSRIHGVLSVRTVIENADRSTVSLFKDSKRSISLRSRASDEREANTRSESESALDAYHGAPMTLGPDGSANFADLIMGSYDLDHLD